MRSSENASRTRSRPARPCAARRSSSPSSASAAVAIASGSSGGTTAPVTPSRTASAAAPTSVVTTGSSVAIASSATVGMPSEAGTDVISRTSSAASTASTSSRSPRISTRSRRPAAAICSSMPRRYPACVGIRAPATANHASGRSRATRSAAATKCSTPFCGLMLPTSPSSGASAGTPSSARTRARFSADGANRATSTGEAAMNDGMLSGRAPAWTRSSARPQNITASASARTAPMSAWRAGGGTRVSTICQTTGTPSSRAASAACGLASPGSSTRSARSRRIAPRRRATSTRIPRAVASWSRGSALSRMRASGIARVSTPAAISRPTAFPGSSGRTATVSIPRSRSAASSPVTWLCGPPNVG